jgi:hypothetical protein
LSRPAIWFGLEYSDSRGRELERQRHAIQPLTDLDDGVHVAIRQGELGYAGASTLQEQMHRAVARRLVGAVLGV